MGRKLEILNLLEENPQDEFLQYALALELEKEGNLNEALNVLINLEHKSPDYLGLYYKKAEILHLLGKSKSAIESIENAMQIAQKQGNVKALNELNNLKYNIEFEM